MQVKIKMYELPPIDERIALLYAGVKKAEDADINLIRDCAKEYVQTAGKVCYLICPIEVSADQVSFTFAKVKSKSLSQRLNGCNYAVIFQALGAERIECLCDIFNGEVNDSVISSGGTTKPRFSAGYGDLPLEFQREIFNALNPQKHIGLYFTESLIMAPSKSVTAVIGVKAESEILL